MNHTKNERLLTIANLNLKYGSKVVLRDINLDVENIVRPGMNQGQVVALLGPSGSGKTQLFRCIAGLNAQTSGTIQLGTTQVPARAGDVGIVQQSYPLLHHRTVWSNLMVAAKPKHGAKAELEATALLNHFGLVDKKNSYPIELSGGQRQRIAIIQQLLCANHFLLMDEPFSGLDVIAKARVYDTVRSVTTAHELNTVIFTTHDLESAVHLADEIWVIGREQGKEGSTVRARLNLIERGIAWSQSPQNEPAFWPTVQELHELFKTL